MALYKKIIIVLFIAFFFRLFIIFVLPVRTFDNTIKRYHNTAVNLIEGRGYSHFSSPPYEPTFLKPPTYSFFLAGIYKIFAVNPNVVKIIQALLDTLGCLLLFSLARDYFSDGVAFTIMFLASACPITAVYTNLLNPESLTVFLMILSLLLISKSILYNNILNYFGAGLSVILMGYSRPEFFIFIFIFAFILFFIKKEKKLKLYLFYTLGIVIIMIPWVARNYHLTGRFIPLSTGGVTGTALYFGSLGEENDSQENFHKFLDNNPELKRLYLGIFKYAYYNEDNNALDSKKASEYSKVLIKMAIDRVLKNPWDYFISHIRAIPRVWINLHADEFAFLNTQKLRLLHPDLEKVLQYSREDPKEVLILAVKYVLFAINIFYLLIALIGLWISRKELLKLSFVIIPLIYAQIFFWFIHPSPCYTVPYWPCIISFSGVGFYHIFLRKQGLIETSPLEIKTNT